MHDSIYCNYLSDLSILIKEKAHAAKEGKAANAKDEYISGYLMALYEVIDLMQQQADAFGIDKETISLADIDPDKELLE